MSNVFIPTRWAKVIFDTAQNDAAGVSNKTIASHPQAVYIPAGARILRAFYTVNTTFTSATDAATIAIQVEGTGDLKAAVAISADGDVYDAGNRSCLPSNYALDGNELTAIDAAAASAASHITTTSKKAVTFVVAVEALTAGKLTLFIEYVI